MEPDEGPPLVFSHHLVPKDLRGGERYQLGPIGHVVNFGYEFELYSDFGDYRVRGIDMLEKRVNEIHALERLEEISKTDAFAKSFSEAPKTHWLGRGRSPKNQYQRWRESQAELFGICRASFMRSKRALEWSRLKRIRQNFKNRGPKAREDSESSDGTVKKVGSATRKLSRRHLGFDRAKRDWARRLKVDPYTTNDNLQYELERIAWASSVGSFAAEFAMPASSVLSYTLQAQELVWSKSELELER